MKFLVFPSRLHRAFRVLAANSCFAALLLAGWNAWSRPVPTEVFRFAATKGETYYTQFSLFHLKYVWLTTNYRKGVLVPVNTQVTFLKASSNEIDVESP